MLDYEHTGPDTLAAEYDALRPGFGDTGSPRLPIGLNLGAQFHWQLATDPGLRDRIAHVLTYPQYWGYLLTGQMACDVTSLGCHTDLWEPQAARFSTLVGSLGLADRFAPVRQPAEALGPILPSVAAATGLPEGTPVLVGIHDSNASLYPHLLTRSGSFAVVSTGTWVVVMAVGGRPVTLDPARDTLINVNALGAPVNSARFMGGREYEVIRQGHDTRPTEADIAEVLSAGLMLLPAVEPGSGPYQGHTARWTGAEPAVGSGQRMAALSFYLALMTDTCLGLTGAEGPVIVEGPFARNAEFRGMLAAATGRAVVDSGQSTGTSIGAALLFGGPVAPAPEVSAPEIRPDWRAYADRWRALAC
jgi:sugar (pentulose or hexulose) kinase